MSNTVVIGAGITGLLAAYYLAKSGHSVTVYEKESYPAMQCSYANGGQVSVSNSEVWTTWSNVWKGLKWISKKDAPLLIRPSLNWDKALWLSKFLYHTAKNDHARRTAETIRMGLESRKLYQEIIQEENIVFDQNKCGILHFYKDQKYFDNALLAQEIYESNGCEWRILNSKELFEIEPNLSRSQGILGGAWTPSDWTGDIHKFCVGLETVLKQKYQVLFMYNCDFESFSADRYNAVVVSAGVGSVELASAFGDSLPIYPVKGYSVTIQTQDVKSFHSLPKVSLLDDQAKIVSSTMDNRLRVAGTAELAGENYDIRRDRITPLLNWVKDNFPNIDRKNYSSWACLRPMTPNMMPIVRQSANNSKVFYHTGHGHLGWTLSPLTAQKLCNIINHRARS